jgi:hypothetical protein
MKDYEFLEPAQIELEEKVKYYNEQQSGLGYEFAREVANTIARILRYPEASTRLSKRTAGAEQKGSIRSRLSDQGRQDPDSRRRPSQKKTVVLAR